MRRAIALGVMLVARVAVAGDCADRGMEPKVLSPANTVIDQDGGVVVGLVTSNGVGAVPDLAKLGWSFGKIPVKQEVLAPGLVMMRPAKIGDAKLELEDGKHVSLLKLGFQFETRLDMPVSAAPVVTSVVYKLTQGRRNSSDGTAVVFKTPVPAGMVAIVGSTPKGVALSWAPVVAGAPSVAVAQSATCVGQAPGTGRFRSGEMIVLRYVDVKGHFSLPTAPIEVK